MTGAEGELILRRLDRSEAHLDQIGDVASPRCGLYQAMIAAYSLAAAMYVGVFLLCRALIVAAERTCLPGPFCRR